MLQEYVGSEQAITIPHKIWAIIYGMAKSRKTSTAVSWPGPLWIAELDCDEERLKYILDRHAPNKEAHYDIILPRNQVGLSEGERDEIISRTEAVARAAYAAGEGTLIIDGGNTLYRLYQIFYTKLDWSAGKPQDVGGKETAAARANFALISQHFDQLLKPMRDKPDLNVVITTEPKEIWAGNQGTGRFEPRGPDSWEFSFDVELMTYVEGGQYSEQLGGIQPIEGWGVVNWSAYRDDRLRGKAIKEPTYEKIRSMLS